MLESTQRLYFRHNLVFNTFKLIAKFIYNINDILKILVSPVDTTEKASHSGLSLTKYHGRNALGIVKVLLWIAVSIAMALLIGRLS